MMQNTARLTRIAAVCSLFILLFGLLPAPAFAEDGMASWYGQPFHGRTMYNGQVFDMYDPTTTAANIFPIGTWLKVTNPANGHSIVVQVRDRGLFKWALDLSYGAFKALDDPARMMIAVHYERVSGPEGVPVAAPPPSPAPQPAPPAQPALPTPTEYVIAAGDTLTAVARRFGIAVASLTGWNGLSDPNRLSVGQKLALRAPVAAPPSPSSRGGAEQAPTSVLDGKYHVVAPGDSMWSLAERYGTTSEKLAAINELDDENFIKIGQQLRLPDSSGVSAASGSSASTGPSYTVMPGDTLFGIAMRIGSSYEALAKANGIDDPHLIQPGDVLLLP